jgi:hypothetical protein
LLVAAFTAIAFIYIGVAQPGQTAYARTGAALTVRHQTRGCHDWSVNGAKYGLTHVLRLTTGARLTVTNNDVVGQRLIQVNGPSVGFAPQVTRPGGRADLTLTKPGAYLFREQEVGIAPLKVIGPHNMLQLAVVVVNAKQGWIPTPDI